MLTRENTPSVGMEIISPELSALSDHYAHKHAKFLRRLSTWREMSVVRKALRLAGSPREVLDLPCGSGRLWGVLAEMPERIILAADYSTDMLNVAKQIARPEIAARVTTFRTSAFDIDREDDSIDSIFCMRLIHHVGESSHRLIMLQEFNRVTRDTLCISLRVDGNHQARRRSRQDRREVERGGHPAQHSRNIISQKQFREEYSEAGFRLIDTLDFLKGISAWRVYVLKKIDSGRT